MADRVFLHIVSALFSILLGLSIGVLITRTDYDLAHKHIDHYKNTPCPYEDSVNCRWNAATSGNHKGVSFTSVLQGSKVYVFYSNGQVIVDNAYRGDVAP